MKSTQQPHTKLVLCLFHYPPFVNDMFNLLTLYYWRLVHDLQRGTIDKHLSKSFSRKKQGVWCANWMKRRLPSRHKLPLSPCVAQREPIQTGRFQPPYGFLGLEIECSQKVGWCLAGVYPHASIALALVQAVLIPTTLHKVLATHLLHEAVEAVRQTCAPYLCAIFCTNNSSTMC